MSWLRLRHSYRRGLVDCHHVEEPSAFETPIACNIEDISSTRLLLLLLPQRHQTHTRNLDHLESHTGDITLGLALATETGEEHFVVLVYEVQATVIGDC